MFKFQQAMSVYRSIALRHWIGREIQVQLEVQIVNCIIAYDIRSIERVHNKGTGVQVLDHMAYHLVVLIALVYGMSYVYQDRQHCHVKMDDLFCSARARTTYHNDGRAQHIDSTLHMMSILALHSLLSHLNGGLYAIKII